MAIIDTDEPGDLRSRFHFSHGLRMELFYALQALTDDSDIHQAWRAASLTRLPQEFHDGFARLGNTALIWPLVADALGPTEPDLTFEALLQNLKTVDVDGFRSSMLIGALHDAEQVKELIAGTIDLAEVVRRAPEQKKQLWFTCVGIFPFDENAAVPRALQRVVQDPDGFRDEAIRCIELFWVHGFAETWADLEPKLLRSVQEKRRLFESSSVAEFLEQAIMRLEVDEERGLLRSVRGGCEIPLDTLRAVHVMPSVFNVRRMWTTFLVDGFDTSYIPYFDATIAVTADSAQQAANQTVAQTTAQARLEPALIFKALGDGTRYGMVQLIGREPRTSADLARELNVSKATISHHLSLLREAGLVGETHLAGSVRLSLRTDVIEQLSALAGTAFAPASPDRKEAAELTR